MRAWVLAALLVLVAPIATPAAAQGGDEPAAEARVKDPAGDVEVTTGFLPELRTGLYAPADYLDILGVWLANETKDVIELGVQMRRWDVPTTESLPWQRIITVRFSLGALNYTVQYYPGFRCTDQEVMVLYSRYGGYNPNSPFMCEKAIVDRAAARLIVPLRKDLLVNDLFIPIQMGHVIRNLTATTFAGVPGVTMQDRAPDRQVGPDLESRVGYGFQRGDLRIAADQPIRASNGEATTMLFRTHVTNLGTQDRGVVLTVDNPNPQWVVRAPQRISLPGTATVDVPVIVSMNFTHEHGLTLYFQLHVEDQADPAHAAGSRLGVRWLDIPQPAGHHDRLWVHSAPDDEEVFLVKYEDLGRVDAWMNALEVVPGRPATGPEIPQDGRSGGGIRGDAVAFWDVFLSPELEIGLDFDLAREGRFVSSIRPALPTTRATVNVTVAYCDKSRTLSGPRTSACEFDVQIDLLHGQVSIGALSADRPVGFEVPLQVNRSIDEFPYRPGGRLLLAVKLVTDVPQGYGTGPEIYRGPKAFLIPRGTTLDLPLIEYHDPIDAAFENVDSLELEALDEYSKEVNPGRTTVFRFDLTNHATQTQPLRLSIEGINAAWASLHGPPTLELGPDERRMVAVKVLVPDDAAPGERAELFLVAENVDDPAVAALARIRATVVDAAVAEITDEASILDSDAATESSPGASPALLLALVVAFAALRRRGSSHKP